MKAISLIDVVSDSARSVEERVNAGRVLAELGDVRPGIGLGAHGLPELKWSEWIPAGSYVLGSPEADRHALDNEKPEHRVSVEAYRISIYPVTNMQFQSFVEAPDGWKSDGVWSHAGRVWRDSDDAWHAGDGLPNFPCVNVSWYAACAFAKWATLNCAPGEDCELRLPSEAEWERACRGTDGRLYPWGTDFDANNCNMGDSGIGGICSVGVFPGGRSPVGALDMAGGTWEWCLTLSGQYPYTTDRDDTARDGKRVIRGGSYNRDDTGVRCAVRREDPPDHSGGSISFRLVCVHCS